MLLGHAYFQRLDAQFIDDNFKFTLHELPYWKNHSWAWTKRCFFNYVRFAAVASRLLRLEDDALRLRYRQQLLRVLRARWREPHILFIYSLKVISIIISPRSLALWRRSRPRLRDAHGGRVLLACEAAGGCARSRLVGSARSPARIPRANPLCHLEKDGQILGAEVQCSVGTAKVELLSSPSSPSAYFRT